MTGEPKKKIIGPALLVLVISAGGIVQDAPPTAAPNPANGVAGSAPDPAGRVGVSQADHPSPIVLPTAPDGPPTGCPRQDD